MKLNGDTFVNVLKNDVNGAEFDTLTTFLATHKPLSLFSSTTLPIGQLQIELHAWDDYGKLANLTSSTTRAPHSRRPA
ncbi:hypothetical protein EDB87DRAFT_647253 [Lactarius vividus]|nr:hypothetical protein EDB87DRAFT_647253 [Lactarius vividus]